MNLVLPKDFRLYSYGLQPREQADGKIVPCYTARIVTERECETCTLDRHDAWIEIPEEEAIKFPRGFRAAIAERAAKVAVELLRHIQGGEIRTVKA